MKAGASQDAPAFVSAYAELRWGLCCQFLDAPIKFRTATHKYVSTLETADHRLAYLDAVVLSNAAALSKAIVQCSDLGIGAFRINSQLLPLATHPESGYGIADLPSSAAILAEFSAARRLARDLNVRLSFHPDQFVVLNSETERVVAASVGEMNHHAAVALLTGAEALTLHGGGAAGGKEAALARLERGVERLGEAARALLALENDDRSFAPADLLPFCEKMGIPFIYDVHHHRCNPDGMTVAEATERAINTWGHREAWMHISSPRDGWVSTKARHHADFIDPADLPREWSGRRITVDVEAKAKERAVIAIRDAACGGQL